MTIKNIVLAQLLAVLDKIPNGTTKINIEYQTDNKGAKIVIYPSDDESEKLTLQDEQKPPPLALPSGEGPIGPTLGPDDDIIDYM